MCIDCHSLYVPPVITFENYYNYYDIIIMMVVINYDCELCSCNSYVDFNVYDLQIMTCNYESKIVAL